MRLLDTNVLSEIVRARPDASVARELQRRRSTEMFASVLSRYELRYGAALRRDGIRFWERIEGELLPLVTWLPVTQEIAEHGGIISAELRRMGRPCGDIDPLLAATAVVHDLIFVTRNLRHFEHVRGLVLENWFGKDG